MKAPALDFIRPALVEEVVATLAQADGEARILAGGQSLVPMLNLRLAYAPLLIDIGGIAELKDIKDQGETVRIGAGVCHARLEDGAAGDHWHGMLPGVARDLAYRAVRNRGTVGGSLAHADPAADWPVALAALGGAVELAGPDGRRLLPLGEFSLDVFVTALEPDEMLTAVLLPKATPAMRWSYRKMRKKAGALGEAIVAVVRDPEGDRTRIVAGSGAMGGPRRLEALEEAVAVGRNPGDAAIRACLEETAADLDRYTMQIHAVSVRRAIEEVLG